MEAMMVLVVLGIWGLMIYLNYCIAKFFERLAADKGYRNCHIWAYTFWLGPVGMLMVAAMPDKEGRKTPVMAAVTEKREEIKEAVTEKTEELPDL